jgi:hypothetical protein
MMHRLSRRAFEATAKRRAVYHLKLVGASLPRRSAVRQHRRHRIDALQNGASSFYVSIIGKGRFNKGGATSSVCVPAQITVPCGITASFGMMTMPSRM